MSWIKLFWPIRAAICLAAACFLIGSSAYAVRSVKAQQTQRIIAVVNDEIISEFDLGKRIKFVIFSSQLPNNQKVIQRITRQVLRGLIDDKLKLQEAKRVGVKIRPKQLKVAIQGVEKRNKVATGGMRKFLTERAIDWRTFELQVEAELAWRETVVRQVRSTIKIGDDVVDEMIAEIKANKGKPEYFVAEIFIPFDPTKSLDETYQNTLRLHSQILSGAKFSALARSFSQSASAAKGGNLGWVRTDQVDENLSKIIVNMTKGSTTKPVKGAGGYYILRLLNKRLAGGLPASDVKVTLQQVFLPVRRDASPGEFAAQNSLAKQISSTANSCAALAKKGVEIGSKQSGRLEVANISRLPINIRNIVKNIPLAKTSAPIRTGAGFLILMVCDRTGGGVTPDVRNRVRNVLLERRATLVARRMLRDIRRSAFVDIRR